MIYVIDRAHNGWATLPRNVSDVAIAMNTIMLLDDLHQAIEKFKDEFPGTNFDGPTLSRELERVLTMQPIHLKGYWGFFETSYHECDLIIFNTRTLGRINDLELARLIAGHTVSIALNRTAYWYSVWENPADRSSFNPHNIVGNLASKLFEKKKNQKQIKGVYEFGTDFSHAETSHRHVAD